MYTKLSRQTHGDELICKQEIVNSDDPQAVAMKRQCLLDTFHVKYHLLKFYTKGSAY